MNTPTTGDGQPSLLPVVGRPCRREGCKRIARRESVWCGWHFERIVLEAYRTPKWATA